MHIWSCGRTSVHTKFPVEDSRRSWEDKLYAKEWRNDEKSKPPCHVMAGHKNKTTSNFVIQSHQKLYSSWSQRLNFTLPLIQSFQVLPPPPPKKKNTTKKQNKTKCSRICFIHTKFRQNEPSSSGRRLPCIHVQNASPIIIEIYVSNLFRFSFSMNWWLG